MKSKKINSAYFCGRTSLAVILLLIFGGPLLSHRALAGTLSLSESGNGTIDHVVTIESPGRFRLVFEAADNWGLSKWYDLSGDPTAQTNLAQDLSHAVNNPGHGEPGLFNQVFNPGDPKAHMYCAKYYQPNNERGFSIIENSPSRIIVEAMYYPIIGTSLYSAMQFHTRYAIYPDGKIFISNKLTAKSDYALTEWRNSVVGLADPSFYTTTDSGQTTSIDTVNMTVTDTSKIWKINQWIGYEYQQPPYDRWEIISNSENTLQLGKKTNGPAQLVSGNYSVHSQQNKFGWIRGTDIQTPYGWTSNVAKYLFEYWDPSTPAPFTDWTKASIMLVPNKSNPSQGKQSLHEWYGFKRFYYVSWGFNLTTGQEITQKYYMQLGSRSDDVMPNISTVAVGNEFADDYLNPAALAMTNGTANGFDSTEGAYAIDSNAGIVEFAVDGSINKRHNPAFKINSYNSDKLPQVIVGGQVKSFGTDFNASLLDSTTLLLQLNFDITDSSTIRISPSTEVLPFIDGAAPSAPQNLAGVLVSKTQVDISWDASTDNVGVENYLVYKDGTLVDTTNGTSYTDYALTEGMTYKYHVTAIDVAGNVSGQSNTLSISTPDSVVPTVVVQKKNYGILPYTSTSADVKKWIQERFNYTIGGGNVVPGVISMMYLDIFGLGSIGEYVALKDFAKLNGFDYTKILLHPKENYTSTIATAWSQLDKFDVFEGKNGVLKSADAVTFTDLTATAYTGNTNLDYPQLYIGYEEPFDQVNFNFATAGQGGAITAEYWNGTSWTSLTMSDGTSNLSQNGKIGFIPPSDWNLISLNSSRNKYFIRFVLSGYAVKPISNKIFGDNWLNGGNNKIRGWDNTSGSIVNSGPLRYNPTPPSSASAKFPYQAGIVFWSPNHFVANPADFQTSIIDGKTYRTWAKYLAERMVTASEVSGFNGIMSDDGEADPTGVGISPTKTDLVDATTNDWGTENKNKYADIVKYVHEKNPSLKVGINGQSRDLVGQGDWNIAEYHTFNWKTNDLRCITSGDQGTNKMCYDDYLPANNPNGIVGVLIYQDTQDDISGAQFDRGNRGPMTALSKHYVAANENTIFSYYTQGGYIYSNTDEVFLKSGKTLHQATEPTPSYDTVKRWGTWFPAMGVDIGVPDTAGYNGGVRNLAWKDGVDIGGGASVWRRDYTKAIVLHRPGSWNSTGESIGTYSSDIDLGGTYYQLFADGTIGQPITTIKLRTNEGVILMKEATLPNAALPTTYSISDFITLISNWKKMGTASDVNRDAIVNSRDLGVMMSKWTN